MNKILSKLPQVSHFSKISKIKFVRPQSCFLTHLHNTTISHFSTKADPNPNPLPTGTGTGSPSPSPSPAPSTAKKVKITFIQDGENLDVEAIEGESILDSAHKNDVELEGACEGSLACSTCHVILEKEVYDLLSKESPPTDEENDMLDLAFGLTDTSRLGCQIKLNQNLNGIKIKIPAATRNMMVDGHKPKH